MRLRREVYVLLELLEAILKNRPADEPVRTSFDRARRGGALASIPGLVYLSPDASPDRPIAVHTGVQRLLRDLDEMPMPDAGYRLLEPPHRRPTLAPEPLAANKVRKHSLAPGAGQRPLRRRARSIPTHSCPSGRTPPSRDRRAW